MKNKRIKQTLTDNVFDIINHVVLILLTLCFVYPLLYVVIASMSNPNDLYNGSNLFLIPSSFDFAAYKSVFQNQDIWSGYLNTIIYTIIGTSINLILTFTAAYPLANKDFKIRNGILFLYTVTLFFGGGLIPTYFVVKNLHLVDTRACMVILGGISAYNMILVRTYIQNNIPAEFKEACSVDGCNDLYYFFKIVLPLSTPIIAVIALFYGIAHWNNYFNALIYLNSKELYPLQLILREILLKSELDRQAMMSSGSVIVDAAETQRIAETMKYAVIIVATLPVLCIYPFVQKQFVKGVMIGSIKG